MEKIFEEKFTYNSRPCRVIRFTPARCNCGECQLDEDMCDIVYVDNNELERFVYLKELYNNTDQKIENDNELSSTPAVQGEKSAKE